MSCVAKMLHFQDPTKARYFSTFDCRKGYWEVPLVEELKDLTTFICSLGNFRHTRAPIGFVSSRNYYNQRSDKALQGLTGIAKIVDDILIALETFESHMEDVQAFFKGCSESNIALNKKKMVLGWSRVKPAGYIVGRNGIEVDPAKIGAVNKFPTPATRQDSKSFMGLISQFRQLNQAVTNERNEGLNSTFLKIRYKFRLFWFCGPNVAF